MMSGLKISRLLLCLLAAIPASLRADDLSSQYQWKPVRIGGGGFVVGMVIHPLDPTVRYARTDVGNPYRWDTTAQQWYPMRVLSAAGSGVHSVADTGAPISGGVEAVAVDPTDKNTVYLVFPTIHSCDIQCPTNFLEIYKSVDGGQNFTPGNMTAAAIVGNPNGPNRSYGERLVVDPRNASALYYGSETQGLFRSLDGGMTWQQFSGAAAPPSNIEILNIQFAKGSGTVTVNGAVLSKTIYAVSIQNSGDAGGDVYQSSDGGVTWRDISTGVTDTASGQSLSHQALSSSIDVADSLYVAENSSTNGGHRAFWRFAAGVWQRFSLEVAGVNLINQAVVSIAADPTNAQRIYALGADTSLARSDDAGATWINLGSPQYANRLAWLPQTVGMQNGEWHSNGGLKIDSSGNLWTPTGQEGTLTVAAATASSATAANPPKWTILSKGIEELVSMEIVVPPGSNDTILATAMDVTGYRISNPDNFSAVQIPLQQEIISQGTSIAYSPDTPSYVAVTSSNVDTNGTNYSGYSTDGGLTWTRFGASLQSGCSTGKCEIPAGMIAVGVRGTRTLGQDHIVMDPPSGFAPEYSQDGGATWHVTSSFPLNADGLTINSANYLSFPYPQLNQHLLRADPFTPDRFYLKFTHAPNSFYISTDGGQTWQAQPAANLPDYAFFGQLAVNSEVQNDLWYADGWAGSYPHGVFHSTDGGQTFQQLPGISHAITIAIGAASGKSGDARYTVYFYGLLANDPAWGVFQSTNGGSSWDRIAYYPTGIYDHPNAMTASLDTYGKVYLGFSGNSFVYGELATSAPSLPGAPTALAATAVSASEIDLTWSAASGTVASYSIYRGTAPGAESATPLAADVTTLKYQDSSVSSGTRYYYKVAAVNSAGQGTSSNEASAEVVQPSIALTAATGSATSATVNPGQSASFQLVLTPANFSGTVSFACSGAPAGYSCTGPAPVSVSPTSGAIPVTISVTASGASLSRVGGYFGELISLTAGFLILPLGLRRNRRGLFLIAVALFAFLVGTIACGGGSPEGGKTNPVTSILTVSASGNGITTVTQTLTITVQ